MILLKCEIITRTSLSIKVKLTEISKTVNIIILIINQRITYKHKLANKDKRI